MPKARESHSSVDAGLNFFLQSSVGHLCPTVLLMQSVTEYHSYVIFPSTKKAAACLDYLAALMKAQYALHN